MQNTDVPLATRARRLAEARRADPHLSAATLAAALGVDRSTLFRTLRAEGNSPSTLIREVRMSHARCLLADGLPVGHVAYAVGYEDASAFARAFRRAHGSSPSGWADGS